MTDKLTENPTAKSVDSIDWLGIESAPKSRFAILVHCPDIKCTFCATWDDITNEWRHFGGSSYPIEWPISHWMPIPSPPNTEEDRGVSR